ncbi:Hypothetical protein A7982_02120 [Minicystis rosea]|nr:Hypothetical protein A7982_02120 [Minicystis rosea]
MNHRSLRPVIALLVTNLALFTGRDASAMCYWTSDGQRPWNDGEYVYELDPSALASALDISARCEVTEVGWQGIPDPASWVDGNMVEYTIRDLFLAGLEDWLGHPSFPIGLEPKEYTGNEPRRVVVTAFCDQGNHFSVENVPGYGVVPHLNIRPNGHTWQKFQRTVRHETGHSFGMAHMHQRWDRDDHVTVNLANIPPDEQGDYTKLTIQHCNDLNLLLPYDLSSIMHYIPRLKPTCSTTSSSGCELSPGSPDPNAANYNPNYATEFNAIQNALVISYIDRTALQLYYPPFQPARPAFYNPKAHLWSFLVMNQGVIASRSTVASIGEYDFSVPERYHAIYGDGDAGARPLVAPWDGGTFDRLGEYYYGPTRNPLYHGDANANADSTDDPLSTLQVGGRSVKLVTVDTVNGVQVLAYVPGGDYVIYDSNNDGVPDVTTAPCGLLDPNNGNEPFSGDFLGDGVRRLAVRERSSGRVFFDFDGDLHFDSFFGNFMPGVSLRPFAGDWAGRGRDSIGLYDATTRMVYLDRNGNFYVEPGTTDAVFKFGSGNPQSGDALLWPAAGHFGPGTVNADIPTNFALSPWSQPYTETMSDNMTYSWEVWQWCLDLNAASNGCFPEVVCEDARTVVPTAYPWPAGCAYADGGFGYELTCSLDPSCNPI